MSEPFVCACRQTFHENRLLELLFNDHRGPQTEEEEAVY